MPVRLEIRADLDATLVLLRHGESMAIVEGRFQGQLETPLSPLGLRQVRLAARRIADPTRPPQIPVPTRSPVEIVHSPLGRTRQTAEAAATALKRAYDATAVPGLRADPGFAELAQGEWEGLPGQEVLTRYRETLEAWRQDPVHANAPGGERVIDGAERVGAALQAVITRLGAVDPEDGTDRSSAVGYPAAAGQAVPWTLVVGHDGIFKVLMCTLLGIPLERFWSFPWGLAAISVVEFVGGRAILRAHNLADHLAPLQAQAPANGSPGGTEHVGTAPGSASYPGTVPNAAARDRSGSL